MSVHLADESVGRDADLGVAIREWCPEVVRDFLPSAWEGVAARDVSPVLQERRPRDARHWAGNLLGPGAAQWVSLATLVPWGERVPFPQERRVAPAVQCESESEQVLPELLAPAQAWRAAPVWSRWELAPLQVARALPGLLRAGVPRSQVQARVSLASLREWLQPAEEPGRVLLRRAQEAQQVACELLLLPLPLLLFPP